MQLWVQLVLVLWPVAMVWLILLPLLAWQSGHLPADQPMPWGFRPMVWVAQHVWPYVRLAALRDRWDRYEREVQQIVQQLPVRLPVLLDHDPRLSQAEADSWMAARGGLPGLTHKPWHVASQAATPEP